MDELLKELGLADLIDLFKENDITPNIVVQLSDGEFGELGVRTIGDRVRLRERCRDVLKDKDGVYHSPVLKRLKTILKDRNSKGKRVLINNRKEKETRRVVTGWKHATKKHNGIFKLMPPNKGGGKQELDILKSLDITEVTEIFARTYFPEGVNIVSGYQLKNLSYFLATFTGQSVELLKPESMHCFGDLVKEIGTSPLRLYLHTSEKESSQPATLSLSFASNEIEPLSQPSTSSRSPASNETEPLSQPSTSSRSPASNETEPLSQPSTSSRSPASNETEPLSQPSTSSRSPASNETQHFSHYDDDDDVDFIDANTPTVSFRITRPIQNRLRIRRTPREEIRQAPIEEPIEIRQEPIEDPIEIRQAPMEDPIEIRQAPMEDPIEIRQAPIEDPIEIRQAPIEDPIEIRQAPIEDIQITEQVGPSDFSMKGILKWWIDRTKIVSEPQLVLVNRMQILKSTLRVVTREDYNFCKDFNVTFSGEDGDDLGGPKREFFRLLLAEVARNIFQGSFFMHSVNKLCKNEYEIAGSLIAFSVLHGGPGLPILHESIYDFMTDNKEPCEYPKIMDCIADFEVVERLEKIEKADTDETYQSALSEISDWCCEKGLSILPYKSFAEKETFIQVLLKNETIYSVHAEIDQFRKGLNRIGRFFDAVMLAPAQFKPLFCKVNSKPLTFKELRGMYHVQFSEEGSNLRRLENQAHYCLEAYVADCEGGATGVTLAEVLGFWTGATDVPPLGFPKALDVTFGAAKQFPTAHTCIMELNSWRGYSDADIFEEQMTKAIRWSGGFHLA